MQIALSLAKNAKLIDEVPIGAVIVKDNRIMGTGFNIKETRQNSCAHAEVIAIESACQNLKSWRLIDCELYVTLEPCIMCAGAIWQSRMNKVYYGTSDPKGGALGSLYEINKDLRLNHRFEVIPDILQKECSLILTEFFKSKRKTPT